MSIEMIKNYLQLSKNESYYIQDLNIFFTIYFWENTNDKHSANFNKNIIYTKEIFFQQQTNITMTKVVMSCSKIIFNRWSYFIRVRHLIQFLKYIKIMGMY